MLDRSNIVELLKINGVDISAPDQEIKSILLSARWHKDDVDTALLVLRENTLTHEKRVDTFHKVFANDEHLKPETISALLGVDIEVSKNQLSKKTLEERLDISFGQIMQIALVSVCFSILFVTFSMWYMHVGMFHIAYR